MCLAFCLQAAGCYSYSGALHVAPGSRAAPADRGSPPGYTDSDLDAGREITRAVAERFGMRSNDEEIPIVNDMNRELQRRYRVLTYFSRHDESAPTRAERAQINMGVEVRDDRSEMIFWIRDLDHGGETDLTRAIRAELERLIRKRLGNSRVRYEQFRISTFMSG